MQMTLTGEEAEIFARRRHSAAAMFSVAEAQVASDGREGDQQPADHRSPQLHSASKVGIRVQSVSWCRHVKLDTLQLYRPN